jgi:hypothetical protein
MSPSKKKPLLATIEEEKETPIAEDMNSLTLNELAMIEESEDYQL